MIDQDSTHVARKATEVIHIKINNPALNENTGKMYIPEIFNQLLGAHRYSNELDQMLDSDLPQGHSHFTIPSKRISRAVTSNHTSLNCEAQSGSIVHTSPSNAVLRATPQCHQCFLFKVN